MRTILRGLAIAVAAACTMPVLAEDHAPPALRVDPLVEQFLEASAIVEASLSPDGRYILAIVALDTQREAVLVDTLGHKSTIVMPATEMPLSGARWFAPDLMGFNTVDQGGARGYVVDLKDGQTRRLEPGAVFISSLHDAAGHPTEWALSTTASTMHDIERVDVRTLEHVPYEFDIPGQRLAYAVTDRRGDLLAVQTTDSALWSDNTRVTVWYRADTSAAWSKVDERRVNDEVLLPVAVLADKGHLAVLTRHGGDRMALWDYDVGTHALVRQLAADEHDDIDAIGIDGMNPDSIVLRTAGLKPRMLWLDPWLAGMQAAIDEQLPGRVNTLSNTSAERVLVRSESDVDPGQLYVFDLKAMTLTRVLSVRHDIVPGRMQPKQAIHYPARDGLSIPAYLTLPGKQAGPLPLVVLVHGGPIARDQWTWDEDVQMLAAHGYAVFQPQFRGSTGFGAAFEAAGHGQAGLAMQDDISDGVRWLIAQKIADPKRVCIVGISYGGYAALWGLASTPELYRCGVSVSGPSDLEREITEESLGSLSRPVRERWKLVFGERDRMKATWAAVSPLRHADRIQSPVLLVHGERDAIVPISHGERMRDALLDLHRDVEWLSFDLEGHGVRLATDRRLWYGAMLELLARTIGEGTPPLPPPPSSIDAARDIARRAGLQTWIPYGPRP
ncbi:MAG TPA: alpha/beta fold hydrolase [Burkholderiaceae bacterium]